ncbi:hypothetical protein DM828_24470 [Pseudomonas umsongensis]|nr:hypothetical protein [Pseudomonas umsongensis]
MEVNDNAGCLTERAVWTFFASRLAPTEDPRRITQPTHPAEKPSIIQKASDCFAASIWIELRNECNWQKWFNHEPDFDDSRYGGSAR